MGKWKNKEFKTGHPKESTKTPFNAADAPGLSERERQPYVFPERPANGNPAAGERGPIHIVQETVDNICKIVRTQGLPFEDACFIFGIPRRTYRDYVERARLDGPEGEIYRSFVNALDHAVTIWHAKMLSGLNVQAAAGNYSAIKFMLERRFPWLYAEMSRDVSISTAAAVGAGIGDGKSATVGVGAFMVYIPKKEDTPAAASASPQPEKPAESPPSEHSPVSTPSQPPPASSRPKKRGRPTLVAQPPDED